MEEGEEKKRVLVTSLTWQNADQLRGYITGTGKLLPRKITRLTAKEQRHLTKIVKQARNLLLMQ